MVEKRTEIKGEGKGVKGFHVLEGELTPFYKGEKIVISYNHDDGRGYREREYEVLSVSDTIKTQGQSTQIIRSVVVSLINLNP